MSEWHTSAGNKFRNGNPGKPHGSSKNKLRDQIKNFVNEQWEFLPGWFSELTAKEKINAIAELLPYCVARLQSVSITDAEGNDLQTKGSFNLSALTDDELKQLINIQDKVFSKNGNDNN